MGIVNLSSKIKKSESFKKKHSDKSIVGHWLLQRISAVILVPLTFWFVFQILSLVKLDREELIIWTKNPINSIIIIAYFLIASFHMKLGLTVIIEDYIHASHVKNLLLGIVMAFSYVLPILIILSILNLSLGEKIYEIL